MLEVPPESAVELDDEGLLKRLSAVYGEAFVAGVGRELAQARAEGDGVRIAEIYERFTYRMHSLSESMKTLLQRFTRWFNRTHDRSGALWEQRYRSVIVECGTAARTMAAYIDLNPVRSAMVGDPAEYRWSSYREAAGGGTKGNGKKAREGLMRACRGGKADLDAADISKQWKEISRIYRRAMGLASGRKSVRANAGSARQVTKNTAELLETEGNETVLPDLGMAKMLRQRVRYFTDGAVIGSKSFVDEAFLAARERFSEKRKDGARRMRGSAQAAAGTLWSTRDLRVGV